jgi:hypothetical protein
VVQEGGRRGEREEEGRAIRSKGTIYCACKICSGGGEESSRGGDVESCQLRQDKSLALLCAFVCAFVRGGKYKVTWQGFLLGGRRRLRSRFGLLTDRSSEGTEEALVEDLGTATRIVMSRLGIADKQNR